MEFFGTKIKKIICIVVGLAVVIVFIFVMFPAEINFSIKEEVEGLTAEEKVQIEQALEQEFLSVWPFENYAVTFNKLVRDKNSNSEYSDVLYIMTIQDTPWFFRYSPVAGERFSGVLAKNKETNKWELVARTCCCMTCAEWY